jgi:undecaprenyl-diphosphatase
MRAIIYPLQRIEHWDQSLSIRFNHVSQIRWLCRMLRVVSRLGDGVLWYALMLSLLLRFGTAALQPVLHMLLTGIACTTIYKWLKVKTSRSRPFQVNSDIVCQTTPLDKFSFPSGHTLHAVAFSIVTTSYYPALCWLVVPFTLLVALSRLVLGLHYLSDVLAGALIGAAIAGLSFNF